ncbi:MAG: AraC family transcriptional regulator ligand-binding domain-containing protein [Proteobacteria bacterium]|nr:AraC family transcriptional regulator ligand-binding domain-containing protein [Pseudomonadota bacterium]
MKFLASASAVRRLLAYLDEIGLDYRSADFPHIDRAIVASRRPLLVSARLIVDLLEASARSTGWDDFGLRYGQWLNLRGLDIISLAWQEAGSIAEWYALAQRYVHLENNSLQYSLLRKRNTAVLIHSITPAFQSSSTQSMQWMLTLTARVFREVVSPDSVPVSVEFMQAAPADSARFREFFRCPIRFGCARNALEVKRREFEQELPGHNPEMMDFLGRYLLEQAQKSPEEIEEVVARIILSELALGRTDIDLVANRLGMSTRSLQRQLKARGTGYADILKSVRLSILQGQRGLRPRLRLGQLADLLGFSDTTAVSRFIRNASPSNQGSTRNDMTEPPEGSLQ